MNRKNVVKTICGALLFLLVLPLFYYVGKLNDKMPVDPIQHLVPDEDHIIGVALITDEESQKELLSYTENGICEFYTDEVNSLTTLADWLEKRGNIYAIISDGARHNPNMYILCNGSDEMEDYQKDFISDMIVCKRSVTDIGTEKEIRIFPDKQGHIWLICTRKDEPGSYYLKDQDVIFTGTNTWKKEETAYAEYSGRTYEHHISVALFDKDGNYISNLSELLGFQNSEVSYLSSEIRITSINEIQGDAIKQGTFEGPSSVRTGDISVESVFPVNDINCRKMFIDILGERGIKWIDQAKTDASAIYEIEEGRKASVFFIPYLYEISFSLEGKDKTVEYAALMPKTLDTEEMIADGLWFMEYEN